MVHLCSPRAPVQYSGLKSLPSSFMTTGLQQYCYLSSASHFDLSGAQFKWELHEGKKKPLLFAKIKQLGLLTAGED